MWMWLKITLYGYSFLRCLSLGMSWVFSSFIGLERIFFDSLNTLWSILSDRSKGKKLSFKWSIDVQNLLIYFRKFRASLSLSFGFRCSSFCLRLCVLVLSFSMHFDCKADKSQHDVSLDLFFHYHSEWSVLHLGSCFKIFDFSISKSSTIFFDVFVGASLIPTWRIK